MPRSNMVMSYSTSIRVRVCVATRRLLTVPVQSVAPCPICGSVVLSCRHRELLAMSSSISCCCGRSFTTSAALKNHSKGCDKNKKRLANVLARAQGLYINKRRRLSPEHSTSRGEGSNSELQDTEDTSAAEIIESEVWAFNSNN